MSKKIPKWMEFAQLVENAGSQGVTTVQLKQIEYQACHTRRISNCREHGYDIRAFRIPGSRQCRYFLMRKTGDLAPRISEEEAERVVKMLSTKKYAVMDWDPKPGYGEGCPFELGEMVHA